MDRLSQCLVALYKAAKQAMQPAQTISVVNSNSQRVFQNSIYRDLLIYCIMPAKYKMLSCRKETARLLCASALAKYNIFCGYYRSIFNHCDVTGL